MRIKYILFFLIILTTFSGLLIQSSDVSANYPQQIPTGSISTVTGTPTGPIVTVKPGQPEDTINVRSGPNVLFPLVGVLTVGQQAVAIGKSPGGEWIQIKYPGVEGGIGWINEYYVSISPGTIPVVEIPPTPEPLETATINPTLAAQFVVTVVPTRLATFTPPPPLVIPTFVDQSPNTTPGGVPIGLVIVIVGVLGMVLGLISFIQRR